METPSTNTDQQYQQVISGCKSLFLKKARDYGTSWTILRMPSVTDQILIKAERIRSIQEKEANMVGEPIEDEFVGIINYCIMALILLNLQNLTPRERDEQLAGEGQLETAYDEQARVAFETMQRKNHDYGEAWRKMRISSITDLILMKIRRLKQIEDQDGKTEVSEGPAANYIDMLNYAVFSLILLHQKTKTA